MASTKPDAVLNPCDICGQGEAIFFCDGCPNHICEGCRWVSKSNQDLCPKCRPPQVKLVTADELSAAVEGITELQKRIALKLHETDRKVQKSIQEQIDCLFHGYEDLEDKLDQLKKQGGE